MKKLSANWKRLMAAALAVFAALGMTACGEEQPPKKEEPIADQTPATGEDEWIGWPDFGEEGIVLPEVEWE